MNNCKNEKYNNICECCPKAENYKFRFYYIEYKNNKELKYYKDIIANNVLEAQDIFIEQCILNNHRTIKVMNVKKYINKNGIMHIIDAFNKEGEIKQ